MTDQPRQIGQVASYGDLHRLLRERADELNLSRVQIDEIAGLAGGHSSKILSPRPLRRIGDSTLAVLLPALGAKLLLVEDPQALARIRARGWVRNEAQVRPK
jgi:hypothetical protein